MSPPVTRVQSDETLPPSADVVVIGGGIAGITRRLCHLAKKGHSVAVVEKGYVAGEQSSRNWGWCRQQNRDLRELPLAQRALEMWNGLNEELGADTGFRRTGLIYVTTEQSDLDAWSSWVDKAREIARCIAACSRPPRRRRCRPAAPDDWIGGVHSPTDGKAEPALAVPAFAEAARRLGVTIHQDCAARGLETTAGRVSRGRYRKGHDPHQCRARRRRRLDLDVLPPSRHRSAARRRALDLVLHRAGARDHHGGLSTPDVTFRRRLDGGYTIGISGRGLLELSPQGMMYAKPFWRTFRKRHRLLTIRAGKSFFDGPEALHALEQRQHLALRAHAHLRSAGSGGS